MTQHNNLAITHTPPLPFETNYASKGTSEDILLADGSEPAPLPCPGGDPECKPPDGPDSPTSKPVSLA